MSRLLLSEVDFRTNPLLQDPGIKRTLQEELMKWASFRLPQLYRTVNGPPRILTAHHLSMSAVSLDQSEPLVLHASSSSCEMVI